MVPGRKGRSGRTLGVSIHKFEAPVGIHGRANVEAILSTVVPKSSGGWFGVDENPTSNWAKLLENESARPSPLVQ